MIRVDTIQNLRFTTERTDNEGFKYGVCHLQIYQRTAANLDTPVNYWWCSCRTCGHLAALAFYELFKGRECECGHANHMMDLDYDWTADRTMRSWEVHQAELSSAFLLGGYEAVQEIAMGLHRAVLESGKRHEARQSRFNELDCDKTSVDGEQSACEALGGTRRDSEVPNL